MILGSKKHVFIVIAEKICAWRKAAGNRDPSAIVLPQELLRRPVRPSFSYPRRDFDNKLGRDGKETTVERAIMDGV